MLGAAEPLGVVPEWRSRERPLSKAPHGTVGPSRAEYVRQVLGTARETLARSRGNIDSNILQGSIARGRADGRRIDLGAAAAEHGLKPMTAKDRQRIAKQVYGILGS